MPLCLAPDIFSDCEKTYPSRMQECSPPLRTVTRTKPGDESMKNNSAYSGPKNSSSPQSVSRKPSVDASSLLHKTAPFSPPPSPLPEPSFCSEVRRRNNIPKSDLTGPGIPPPPPLPATPHHSAVQEDISREISDRVESCVSVKKVAEKLSLLANAWKPPVPDKKPVLSVPKAPPGDKMPALRLRSPSHKAGTGTGTNSSPPSTSRPAPTAPPRTSSLANISQESPTTRVQASQPTSPSLSCLSRGQSFRVAPPPPPACGRERTTSTESVQFARKFSFRAAPPPPPPVKPNRVSSNTELGSPSNMLIC